MSEPKRWWACECDLNEQPSKIAYEREYQLELVEAKELAALRATIAQQAQELAESERKLRGVCMAHGPALLEIHDLKKELAASQARCRELDYKIDIVGKDFTSNMMYQGQLERTNADLQATLAARCRELEDHVGHYKSVSTGQYLKLTEAKTEIAQLQATLTAREAELHACQSNLKQSELERDAAVQEVERLKKEHIRYKLECYDVRRQLAASQERARELEGEIVKHRPKSECYDRVCQSLGISHDILGHVATLQATLAERERELHALATRHDAMLLRLGEVERDLYDAFHKHGQDNGMWGKWCARLLTQRNTARQDAARLMEALEAVLPIVKEVAAIEQAQAALKGQH